MILTTSARVAIAAATANGRETLDSVGAGVPDSLSRILHGLDCGRVLAAIDDCDPLEQDWLVAAYATDGWPGKVQAAVRCQAQLYAEYTRRRAVRACTGKMLRLAAATMVHTSYRGLGAPGLAPAAVAELVGFDVRNWDAWQKAMHVMMDVLDGWDARGLGRVAKALGWREAAGQGGQAEADPVLAEIVRLLREAEAQRERSPIGSGIKLKAFPLLSVPKKRREVGLDLAMSPR